MKFLVLLLFMLNCSNGTPQNSPRVYIENFTFDNQNGMRKREGTGVEINTPDGRFQTWYNRDGVKEGTETYMFSGQNLVYLNQEPVVVRAVLPSGRCALVANTILEGELIVEEYCNGNRVKRYSSGFFGETWESCVTLGGLNACRRDVDNRETQGDFTSDDAQIHYTAHYRKSPHKLYTMTLVQESENSRIESSYEMRTDLSDPFPSKFDPRWSLRCRQIEDQKIPDIGTFARQKHYDQNGTLTAMSNKTVL